jgi:hypothetical protein
MTPRKVNPARDVDRPTEGTNRHRDQGMKIAAPRKRLMPIAILDV